MGQEWGIFLFACTLLCHRVKNVRLLLSLQTAGCHFHYLLPTLCWKKNQETLRSIRGNDSLDGNNWVSGKDGGMLIAITTLSYIPRALGLFIAELKVTLPPVLRMEKLKHVTVAFQGSLRNGTPTTR